MKNQQIVQLLTPSWVSNLVGVVCSVIVVVGTIVISHYEGSELRQQIFENQTNVMAVGTRTSPYDTITTNVAHNSFLSSLPLLLTWAAVGLVVYFFAVSIARSFGQAADLRDRLEYVNTTRQAVLRTAVNKLLIRGVATIGWFLLIKLTVAVFVPYALAAASVAAQSLSLANVAYGFLAAAVIFVTVYLHTLFLRLIMLRPRLFSR